MKRHDALRAFSHDHQHALAQALRLRRCREAAASERRAELDRFLAFASELLEPHFRHEEALMEQVASTHGHPELAIAHARMLQEHAALSARVADARSWGDDPDPEGLFEIGEQLTEHVRFEERTLFQLLQRELGEELAAVVGTLPAE